MQGAASAADGRAVLAGLVDLVLAVGRERDRDAFAALFVVVAPRCKGLYLSRGATDAVADELSQDMMIAVWREAQAFDPACDEPEGWLLAIAQDTWARAFGRWSGMRAAEEATAADGPPGGADGEALAERAERMRRLRSAFLGLPPALADLLRDVYVEGLSHGAIARRRGLALGAVKARLRSGIRGLRDAMGVDPAR